MIDAYQKFFSRFKISDQDLIQWGIQEAIFPNMEGVILEWERLKEKVLNNERVYIRGYGRNAHGTHLYQELYAEILGNYHVERDPTNNSVPQRIIKKLTGLQRNRDIYNYQVSHIFGKTKNPFLFQSPWNICYLPKIMDPFTGHESKGNLSKQFQKAFKEYVFYQYKPLIEDYNQLMLDLNLSEKAKRYLNEEEGQQFLKDVMIELSPIILDI